MIKSDSIIDCHAHACGVDFYSFYLRDWPMYQDIRVYSKSLLKNGIDYSIVTVMPTTAYFDFLHYKNTGEYVPSGACEFPYELENEELLGSIERYGLKNILPFACFSLYEQEKQISWLRKNNSKIFGLKYHCLADQNRFDKILKKGRSFLAFAEEFDKPIMIHTGLQELDNPYPVIAVAKEYPRIRFNLAHCAAFNRRTLEEILEIPNIYMDISPFVMNCHIWSEHATKDSAELDYNNPKKVFGWLYANFRDKLLWGSDSPCCYVTRESILIDYEDELRFLDSLLEDEKRTICSSNPRRYLFGEKV